MTKQECIHYAIHCGCPRYMFDWFPADAHDEFRTAISHVGSMIEFWQSEREHKLTYVLLAIEIHFYKEKENEMA